MSLDDTLDDSASQVTHEPAVTQENPFVMVPHWVLGADISDRAVRLYMAIARYANLPENYPSRRALAGWCRCSVDSVDRAMKELVGIGAVRVTKRYRDDNEGQSSNLYHLPVDPSRKTKDPSRDVAAPPAAEPRHQEKENVEEGASPTSTKSRRKPETPFPEGKFPLTDAMLEWALGLGFDKRATYEQTQRFKDHALTHDRRCRDWVAAWRSWMRKAPEMAPRYGNGNGNGGNNHRPDPDGMDGMPGWQPS